MPGIEEASGARTPLASDLAAGVDAISLNQVVTFTLYQEEILPLDGSRFWCKIYPVVTLPVKGSLHYASDISMEEAENITINRMVFTSEQQITPINRVGGPTIWIGEFDGVRFAFSSRASYYKQAGLFHYAGNAIYPDMATQVIDSAGQIDTNSVIVSNSLPLWLAINNFIPPNAAAGFACPARLYPAFLMPQNILPPFAAIDIPQESTSALQSAPTLDAQMSHDQLVTERVRVTLWGLRNDEAMTFVDCINQYSLDLGTFGIMNMPVVRDAHRIQSELSIVAQKKVIDYEINYHQVSARSVARQLIEAAQVTYFPQALKAAS